MKKFIIFLAVVFAVLLSDHAQAFNTRHWWMGVGYYSENALNEVAGKNSGAKGFLGEANWPLIFRFDWAVSQSWFLAPQLNYTVVPRKTKDDTATVSLMHLVFPVGKNAGPIDWSFGPGILRETIKGKGGTVTLNNGTGSSTFAQPGREVSLQKITLSIGAGYTAARLRWGLDLYFVAPLSSDERTQNLMLSLTYDLSTHTGNGG